MMEAVVPFPSKNDLPRVLAGRLLEADPEGAVWTGAGEALEAASQVKENYRADSQGRTWDVGGLTEKIAPETYRHLFVVIRGEREELIREPEGYGHLKFITVARGDRVDAVYENTSQKKASAVADALNRLEEDP